MAFEYTIPEKLSSDLILSKVSEESIMQFYLGINIRSKKLFCSPLRADRHPTCSLFRNSKGRLIYKDFGDGSYLDCWNFVMKKYGVNYYQALKIIANDFNIQHDSSIKKNKGKIVYNIPRIEDKDIAKIQIEAQDFTELELKWWNKYGITEKTLKKFNVFSCKHIFLNGNLYAQSQQHNPIFGYYGGKYQGLELWRCYFPKSKSTRFLTNWPSKKIQGYSQLPKSGKVLVITKSMKDTMLFDELGIPSCSPNSETQFISDSVLEDLKKRFKKIIVVFDSDYTGITFMNKLKKKHPEFIYTWVPRKYGAKDISDFYKANGKKKTIKLINEFISYIKKK